MKCKRSQRAFTLVEMAVVLVIIGVVVGSSAVMGSRWLEAERWRTTNRNLDVIERAIMTYYRINQRLPCPGDIDDASTSANLGLEAATPGTCTGGAPAANFSSGNTVAGALPVQALDIPRSFMVDGWNRRIVYHVDRRMTAHDAATAYPYDESVAIGSIAVHARLTGGTSTVQRNSGALAIYALLSHGPDGHGAYLQNGTRFYAGSTDTQQWENCDCNATAGTAFDGDLAQSSPLSTFDDIVRYKRRSQLYDVP